MRNGFLAFVVVAVSCASGPARAADEFAVDGVHSSVTFKVSHLGLSWVHGRFNEFTGNFVIAPDDAGKCSFGLSIKAESIDTNSTKRDEHLRSRDFFNVKQFPALAFKSPVSGASVCAATPPALIMRPSCCCAVQSVRATVT